MASTYAAKRSSARKKFPNWTEMPDELMVNILQRLGVKERLTSTRKVCTTWRRICKDPSMWKVIEMQKSFDPSDYGWGANWILEKITKKAVDLSCGELIDISIYFFGSDDLLDYIVRRSSKLKCLRVLSCMYVTGSGLIRAVKMAPQLEKLDLSDLNIEAEDLAVIGQNCPQLKSFTVAKHFRMKLINCDKFALAIANNMPELRHLKVFDREMTNDGLKAIMNGCPHLESLDVRNCNLYLDGKLGKLCMERVKDFKYGSIPRRPYAVFSSFRMEKKERKRK